MLITPSINNNLYVNVKVKDAIVDRGWTVRLAIDQTRDLNCVVQCFMFSGRKRGRNFSGYLRWKRYPSMDTGKYRERRPCLKDLAAATIMAIVPNRTWVYDGDFLSHFVAMMVAAANPSSMGAFPYFSGIHAWITFHRRYPEKFRPSLSSRKHKNTAPRNSDPRVWSMASLTGHPVHDGILHFLHSQYRLLLMLGWSTLTGHWKIAIIPTTGPPTDNLLIDGINSSGWLISISFKE